MTKAEERALEAYPEPIPTKVANNHHTQLNKERRRVYRQGYNQAEKDLALTAEDVERIYGICCDVFVDYDGRFSDEIWSEVVRRFNKL